MNVNAYLNISTLVAVWSIMPVKSLLKSGPYKTTLLRIANECDDPALPYEKERSVIVKIFFYNTTTEETLMGGNITVLKTPKVIKGNIKVYMGKSTHPFTMLNNLTCRSLIVATIIRTLGHRHNDKICSPPKGTYSFRGINPDRIEHITRDTMPYGTMMIRTEIRTNDATLACWKTYMKTTPVPLGGKNDSAGQ